MIKSLKSKVYKVESERHIAVSAAAEVKSLKSKVYKVESRRHIAVSAASETTFDFRLFTLDLSGVTIC